MPSLFTKRNTADIRLLREEGRASAVFNKRLRVVAGQYHSRRPMKIIT